MRKVIFLSLIVCVSGSFAALKNHLQQLPLEIQAQIQKVSRWRNALEIQDVCQILENFWQEKRECGKDRDNRFFERCFYAYIEYVAVRCSDKDLPNLLQKALDNSQSCIRMNLLCTTKFAQTHANLYAAQCILERTTRRLDERLKECGIATECTDEWDKLVARAQQRKSEQEAAGTAGQAASADDEVPAAKSSTCSIQ